MPDFLITLANYGVTPVGIVGAIGTVGASYLSARWGGAESRTQFKRKTEDDERAAAAQLIPLLLAFADRCDEKNYNLSTFISTHGADGTDEPMYGIDFDAMIFAAAARLGPGITERAIKLQLVKSKAESAISNAEGYIERSEANEMILSYLSLLSLKARFLVDMASRKVGLAMLHPPEQLEDLREESFNHAHRIDSGDDTKWY